MKLAASISNVNNPERVDIGESSNEKRNTLNPVKFMIVIELLSEKCSRNAGHFFH